jgi:hypothetical protein
MQIIDPTKYAQLIWDQVKALPKSDRTLMRQAAVNAVKALRSGTDTSSTPKSGMEKMAYQEPNFMEFGDEEWTTPGPTIGLVKNHHQKSGISIALVGEAHKEQVQRDHKIIFLYDETRSLHVLGAMRGTDFGSAPLVIIERGLPMYDGQKKKYTGEWINESQVTAAVFAGTVVGDGSMNLSYTPTERSLVLTGYILACLEADTDSSNAQITLFFGENHKDIFTFLEEYAEALSSNVLGRERSYLVIKSQLDRVLKAKEEERLQRLAKEKEEETDTTDWSALEGSLF